MTLGQKVGEPEKEKVFVISSTLRKTRAFLLVNRLVVPGLTVFFTRYFVLKAYVPLSYLNFRPQGGHFSELAGSGPIPKNQI